MPDSTRNKILVDTTTTTDKSKPCVDLQMNVRIRRFSVLQITDLHAVRFAFAGQECIQNFSAGNLCSPQVYRKQMPRDMLVKLCLDRASYLLCISRRGKLRRAFSRRWTDVPRYRSETQQYEISLTAYLEIMTLPAYEAGWYSDAVRRRATYVRQASQLSAPIGLFGYDFVCHALAQVLCDLDSLDSTQWASTLIVLFHTSADTAHHLSGHVYRYGVSTWSWTQYGGRHSSVDIIWHQVLYTSSSCALWSHRNALSVSRWVLDYKVQFAPVHLLLRCCISPHTRPLMLVQCPLMLVVPWGFITPFDHQGDSYFAVHPDYGNRVLSISTWPYCKIMKGSHWVLRLGLHGRVMSFSPENPELPTPGDHRPPLPRLRRAPIPRRRAFLRTPLPRHRQKPSIRDDDRAGSAVGERGEVRSSVRYAPLLANVEPVAVLEEEATCYTQFGDPEIEIPMTDALKSLYPPGTRLLEADSGSRRTRIVDTSDVTDDAFASFAAQRGDNAQVDPLPHPDARPKPRSKKMPRPKSHNKASGSSGVIPAAREACVEANTKHLRRLRFLKIRGSLRECLRTKGGVIMASKSPRKAPTSKRPAVRIPPAHPQRSGYTEVTCEPLPKDDAPTEDVMVGRSAPSAPDYDAIHRERLHRVLTDERRRALLMWQREQFFQRAAVVRAQALASRRTSASEVGNPTIAPATVPDPLLMPDPSTRAYMVPSCEYWRVSCSLCHRHTSNHTLLRSSVSWLAAVRWASKARNALTTHLYIVSEVSISFFIGAVRGPKSAVHTVLQYTTKEDHVHVPSVDGARVVMVAEAITEALPVDRSFFRIANQLGKQQGYEPEKLQGTACVHYCVGSLIHNTCFLSDAPFSDAPAFGSSALRILPVHIMLMPLGACRLDLSLLVCRRSRMWRWWRFRKALARRLRRVRRKRGRSGRRFLGRGMCAYTHLRDFVLDQVGLWSSFYSHWTPSTSSSSSSATMYLPKPMHRLLWCLCLCLHFPEVVSTKDVSTSLPMTSGMQSSSFPWQRKRAYNRACRRAMEHGTTIYRGRPFQLPTGSTLIRSEGVTRSSMRRHHDRSSGRRLSMLTWNCGGASAIYDQFLLWLFQSRVEMAVLVETKWSFSQCWSDQHYHYIHSGAGSRKSSGGVLVILSRQLTHSQAIRYHEAIPGHLLRVSFTPHGSSCAFNLIGLYQHVWTSGNLSIRHTFWTKLSGLCHSIPARSCLLLAGDCNATCQPEGRLVGSGVPKSFVAEDSSELQDILRAHGLVALNTFGQAPGYTFRFGPRASQLDYVFTRIAHADREAKLAKANYDFPVGRHVSADAAYHFPISTTIACSWHTRPHCTHRFNIDVHRLAEDVQKGSKEKYEVFSEITRNWSTEQPMDASDPETCLQTLNHSLLSTAGSLFPAQRQTKSAPWQNQLQTGRAARMWALFRRMRSFRGTRHGIFHAWRCWCMFSQLHKEHSKYCKILRKQRITDALEEAEQAAQRHDTWALYRIVRRLAPKVPSKKFQIQQKGKLLSPQEELQTMVKYYEELYAVSQVTTTKYSGTLSDDFPVTAQELLYYLQQIPLRKAVSRGSVPGVVYRICAQALAPALCKLIRYMWNTERLLFPRIWCVAELIFLPKPGKKTTEVKDWRPIGLQDAVAKSVMHMLVDRLKPYIQAWAAPFPLYAYMPHRSTKQALQVVFQHCDNVRQLCEQEADTIHRRFQGWKPNELCGGLQVCLDLSSAFDRVPWQRIEEAFSQAQVPSDLTAVILGWLHCSEYQLHNNECTSCIKVGRGVKQGCRGSPTIFLAFMTLFCSRLNEKLGGDFCQEHLTQYADDTHSAWIFRSFEELRRCVWQLSVIMDTLEEFGMTLNDEKAQILFTVRGQLRQQARKAFTTKIKDCLTLRVEGAHGTRHIPLVKSTVYLGAKISYDQFESQTIAHRMQKANVRFWQLQKFFTSKRGLSTSQRIRMWLVTIRPTLMYAVDCCPISPVLQRQLQTLVMKHLRAICSCPSHISHISDAELLKQHKLSTVSGWLGEAYDRDRSTIPELGISETKLARWGKQLRDALQATQVKLTQVNRNIQPHACPICGVYFDSRKSVKLHMYQSHKSTAPGASGPDVRPADQADVTSSYAIVHTGLSTSADAPAARAESCHASLDATGSVIPSILPVVSASSATSRSVSGEAVQLVPVFSQDAGGGLVFDRSVHSRDGLPTCSGCGAKFRRWDILRKHINKGWCPIFAKHDAKAPATVSAVRALAVQDHQSIICRPEVIQAVIDRGLEGLRAMPGLLQEMQNRCVLCHTWVAHTFMMKNHYRNTHGERWEELISFTSDVRKHHAQITSPCRYCGVVRVGGQSQTTAHAKSCTVLFQCAVLCYDHGRRSGKSDRRVLWGSGESRCIHDRGVDKPEATSGSKQLAEQSNKASPSCHFVTAQGKRKRPTTASPAERSIHRGVEANHKVDGQVFGSSRRRYPDTSAGHGARMVCSGRRRDVGHDFNHSFLAGCGSEMAWQGKHRDVQSAAPRGHVHGHSAEAIGQVGRGLQGSDGCTSMSTCRMAYDRAKMGLSEVVQGYTHLDSGQDQDSGTTSNPGHIVEKHASDGGRGSSASSVLLHSQTGSIRDRSCSIRAGSVDSGSQRYPGVPGPSRFPGKHSLAAHRGTIQARESAAGSGGARNPETSGRYVMQALRLHNVGNHCYANAWCRSMLWVTVVASHGQALLRPLRVGFDTICAEVQKGRMVRLMTQAAYRELLHAWISPDDQHDVVEFAMYVLTQVGAINLLGSWQARTQNGDGAVVHDTGHVIILHPNRNRQSLHLMLSTWEAANHGQVCAFQQPPTLVLMQVMRFRNDASGRLRRLQLAVKHVMDEYNIPIFSNAHGLDVYYQLYRPVAVICHRGRTPKSGHYTAILIDDFCMWHCDDNAAPECIVHPSLQHYSEVYAVLCIRKEAE